MLSSCLIWKLKHDFVGACLRGGEGERERDGESGFQFGIASGLGMMMHEYFCPWISQGLCGTLFKLLPPFTLSCALPTHRYPRSKCLLISWLPCAVILEPPKIKSATVSTVSPSICEKTLMLGKIEGRRSRG